MDYKDLGARVRAARRQQGLTQEKLADLAGISASFLGHIERGSRVASLETLVDLCNAMNVTPEYLLASSLHKFDSAMPEGLSEGERVKLNEFLRLAQDTLKNWNVNS